MLTKLLPDQVAKFWDIIKYSIEESLPPIAGESPDTMNNILTSLLTGKTQCWASYTRGPEGNKFEGIILTKILLDDASMTRSLLIYCLYGYEKVNKNSWREGFLATAKFAKSMRCNRIVGYTNVPYLIDLAKVFGSDNTYQFVSFDIDKTVEFLNNLGGI
jgi:hypothetical protein